jgi:hypothetical protein
MSWLFSRALVAEYSADISLDGAQSALWSGTHTQRASWLPVKTTDAFRLSRSGMTYRPLTDDHGEGVLMSFLEAFPARTFLQQEREPELMENEAGCGDTWHASLARYDQATSSWKTHQYSLLGGLEPFLETWPRWGMMHAGECWELATPELPTNESESGSWPTPTKSTAGKSDRTLEMVKQGKRQQTLDRALAIRGHGVGLPNPMWVEWLMGWPTDWTALQPLETDKFQQWLHSHGICSEEQPAA